MSAAKWLRFCLGLNVLEIDNNEIYWFDEWKQYTWNKLTIAIPERDF